MLPLGRHSPRPQAEACDEARPLPHNRTRTSQLPTPIPTLIRTLTPTLTHNPVPTPPPPTHTQVVWEAQLGGSDEELSSDAELARLHLRDAAFAPNPSLLHPTPHAGGPGAKREPTGAVRDVKFLDSDVAQVRVCVRVCVRACVCVGVGLGRL